MTGHEFYNRVTNSKLDVIHEFLEILHQKEIPYAVIGGVGINAYCEPIVTLDFDCVVIIGQTEELKNELKRRNFKIKTHPYTWEVTHKLSEVRIQIQQDDRYQEFISRAESRQVFGYIVKVAQKEDLLRGKIWAYQDASRNELKRDKDLLDIKRLVQKYPNLTRFLNDKIKEKLLNGK